MNKTKIAEYPGRIDILVGGNLFTSYCFGTGQSRPWFDPLNSPSGTPLTADGNSADPHRQSLWFGAAAANGYDFWHHEAGGRIVSVSSPVLAVAGSDIKIEHDCSWTTPEGKTILQDRRSFRFQTGEEDGGYVLDLEFALRATEEEVTFTRSENALLAVQMGTQFTAGNHGVLHNSMSDEGEKETNGEEAFWCDCSGTVNGAECGLSIFSHPDNPVHPPTWVTKDNGYFSPNFLHSMDEEAWSFPSGEEATFRYRVLCHEGDVYDGNVAVYWGEYAAGY